MAIDLAAELRAALQDPTFSAWLRQEVVKPGVAEALAEHAADAWLSAKQASTYVYGVSGAEERFRKLRERHPELDRLSSGSGKLRRWRRADLDAFLATRSQRGRSAAQGEP